jgi:2-dehydro-3-deoxy-L-rhamnonate dehydrogenase (NAD+)
VCPFRLAPRPASRHLGSLGASVVLLDMMKDKLESAVEALAAKGVDASYQVINVTLVEDWDRAVAAVVEAKGRVDILVQAAGITGKTGIKTHEVDPANFDAVMSVNARGIFLGCRAVLPAMVRANYGRILNIASIAGKEGNAGMAPYSASKGAGACSGWCGGRTTAGESRCGR